MSEEQTLNQEGPSSEPDPTLNTGTTSMPMETEDGLLSTAEFVDEPVNQKDPQEPGKDEEGEPKDEKGPVPYDRFQEKVKQVQELTDKFSSTEEKLSASEKRIAELERQIQSGTQDKDTPKDEKVNFKSMQNMSDDELKDWLDSSTLGFVANLAAQIQHETVNHVLKELDSRNRTATYQEKLSEFGKEHGDFNELLNSGKIENFVRSNVGHDVFSAYYELTADKRQQSHQKSIDEAVAEALAKQKKEYEKNLKAKRELRTISGGANQVPHDSDAELKDTSATGGLVSTLAARLATRRKKAG